MNKKSLKCEVIVGGKCVVCGKTIKNDRIFLCADCQKKQHKEEVTYKSPIEIFINDVNYSMEQAVLAAVSKCEIKVNKDELVKALTYDRKQYEEGYRNAMKQIPKQLTEEDYIELRDRFGEYVEFVVRDMITGKEERWK